MKKKNFPEHPVPDVVGPSSCFCLRGARRGGTQSSSSSNCNQVTSLGKQLLKAILGTLEVILLRCYRGGI